jgi:hypothetical protein
VRFEFTYTPEDLKQALRYSSRFSLGRLRISMGGGLVGWLIFVALAAAFFVWMKHNQPAPRGRPFPRPPASPAEWLLPILPWVAVLAFIWFFIFRRLRHQAREAWEKNPVFHLPHTVDIDDQGIRFNCALVDTLYRWPYFVGWAETRDLLLLHLPNQVRVMIPKRAANNPNELDKLRAILKTHVHEPTGGFPMEIKPAVPINEPAG